jgi:hypothetical protein
MTTVNWGMLAKSMADPETIEQAITRLITAHNVAETAHLGAGQSLDMHKVEAVLDHLVGSVVADKLTHTEGIIKTNFESIAGWTTLGTVTIISYPGLQIECDWAGTKISMLSTTLLYRGDFLDYIKNVMFQITGWLDSADANTKAHFGLGLFNSDANIEGFGFRIVGSEVKAFWGKGATISWSSDLAVDPAVPHVYRAQYDAVDLVVRFYIDGVIKATLTLTSPISEEPDIYMRAEQAVSGQNYFKVQELIITKQT